MPSSAPARRRDFIPLVTAFALFVALLFVVHRDQQSMTALAAQRDSAGQVAMREAASASQLLGVGDSLPPVVLRSASLGPTTLSALPTRYRYLYFGRETCGACSRIAPVWMHVEPAKRDSIVFIDFDPNAALPAPRDANHFAWTPDSSTVNRYIVHVPTLLVRDSDGRILTAAHGSAARVVTAATRFGLISRPTADSTLVGALGN